MSFSIPRSPFVTSRLLPNAEDSGHVLALLRTNAAPPDHIASTIASLSNEVERHDTEILECEKEIALLQQRVQAVASDRASLVSYLGQCRGLLAPIRRMPPEVLARIFTRSEAVLPIRRSNLPIVSLFALSQVCSQWHTIVMGTPSLWDTIVVMSDDMEWSKDSKLMDRNLRLLSFALDRGAKCPLHLDLSTAHPQVLSLLADHSDRWNTAELCLSDSADLLHLSAARGNLPSLETLNVFTAGGDAPVDIFNVAPKLRNLAIAGRHLETITIPPLVQLRTLSCLSIDPTDVHPVLAMMSTMPHGREFRFQLWLGNVGHWTKTVLETFVAPPTTSNIAELSAEFADYCDAQDCRVALNKLLACLTLPHLRKLSFDAQEFPNSQVYWPADGFLALAKTSPLASKLQSLDLGVVVLSQAELFSCLAGLPSLQSLCIADHQTIHEGPRNSYGVDHHLIDDALLSRLALTTEQPLVPNLRTIMLRTRLQFDDTALLDFLRSRRRPRADDVTPPSPFTCEVQSLRGRFRELDPTVCEQLRELRIRREVLVMFSGLQHPGLYIPLPMGKTRQFSRIGGYLHRLL
ncbi:hypothetical protein FB45DRAFT_1053662 [Roridomyces roridus]|uniref:F-box domain-containing protein n=1 Tax=Roridomyces roridus TaxID=1738132 RepID=A0AAD7C6S8_9AGAR|nr:hypothetical protein FB45DRAFT_1053662 [Roridomyces roridus]